MDNIYLDTSIKLQVAQELLWSCFSKHVDDEMVPGPGKDRPPFYRGFWQKRGFSKQRSMIHVFPPANVGVLCNRPWDGT